MDRFDGQWQYPSPGNMSEFNPCAIREVLNMHTMEKIHDVILIMGVLLMLVALMYDTVSIASFQMHKYAEDIDSDICIDANMHKRAFCQWLKDDVGLIQFLPNFKNAGFDDIRILQDLKQKDLREMNITHNGHIKILMKCIDDVDTYRQT